MMDLKPTLDEERYPTDETERIVREFKGDGRELLAAIKEVWAYPEYWREEDSTDFLERPAHRYYVSTAGWSGNESLIEALRDNFVFWMMFWQEERRGGHFIFEISGTAYTSLWAEIGGEAKP